MVANPNKHCHAGQDGECYWAECPQLRDREPHFSGRDCPNGLISRAVNAEDDDTYLAECRGCRGTGLYVSEKERQGEAVICVVCEGAGGLYTDCGPVFSGRREYHNILKVYEGVDRKTWMAYDGFLESVRSAAGAPVTKARPVTSSFPSRRDAVNATKKKLGL